MILKDEKRNSREEKQKVYKKDFLPNESNFKTDKKSETKNNENVIKDIYESISMLEKNNINDAHVEINDYNENKTKKNDNKFETNINEHKENDLLNSKIIKCKSNSTNKPLFSIQKLDGPKDSNIKEKKPFQKRGRVKKLKNRRFHSKNDKDNIELKIHGLIIDSCRSFINKKLKKKLKKELKKVRYKEKRKFNMDKRLKSIFKKVSKRFEKNYNKDIIAHCGRKLKKIFNLRMYKVIQAISGVEIKILKNLRKEYNSLKEQKLLKEDKNYIKLFNEKESSLINLALDKYPIIKENTKIQVLNSKNIIDLNLISKNNAKISEIIEFANEKTTKSKTLDFKNIIDKAFISNNNKEKLDIKELPYQNPVIEALFLEPMQDIPTVNDKNVETEKFLGMPPFSDNNNIGDYESSSSQYSLIKIPENDDIL